ncbi:MAG: LysR family transcriptional regulator [Rhizobiaceae bacterium]|nr:LysR family transcriptional regulator [Rhizobiaceae bacterium]
MNLRQLQYFIAVARSRSFSRGGGSLDVAQSAMSRQIQTLEEELSTTLLIRDRRGLKLTEAGELVLEHAEIILEQVRLCREDVKSRANVPRGALRIGVVPSLGTMLMPKVLVAFRDSYPDVSIHLRSNFSGFLVDWLNADLIDLAVMHTPWLSTNFIADPIVVSNLAVALPPERARRRLDIEIKDRYDIADIARLPLIVPSRDHPQRLLLEREADANKLDLNIILEVDDLAMVKMLVQDGMGCTVINYHTVHNEVVNGLLRVAPLKKPGIKTDFSIVTRDDRAVTAAMKAMISSIKNEMKKLARSGELPEEYFRLKGTES